MGALTEQRSSRGAVRGRPGLSESDEMDLSKLLSPAHIRVPLEAHDKLSAIHALIGVLAADGSLSDRDLALQAVLKREADRSTGIGFGLAIPHGKTDGTRQVVMAAGKPGQPIDFQSVDDQPVTFIVMLVSPPDQTGAHIQALAKLSKLMKTDEFRDAVARAASAEELHAAIVKYEARDGL